MLRPNAACSSERLKEALLRPLVDSPSVLTRSLTSLRRRPTVSWLACGVICLAGASVRCTAQKRLSALQKPPFTLSRVSITEFGQLIWRPDTDYFNSPGPVRILLEDTVRNETILLIADDAEGSPNDTIKVKGKLRLERPEGLITGRMLEFRPDDQTGSLLDAVASAGGARVYGSKIELMPKQVLVARNASATTCSLDRPDFRISARELRMSANGTMKARDVSIWLGGTKVFVLPYFEKKFGQQVSSPFPLPGYSKDLGLRYRIAGDFRSDSKTSFDYDIGLSLKRTPTGTIAFEQDTGSPAEDAPPPKQRAALSAEPLRSALESESPLMQGSTTSSRAINRGTFYGVLSANAPVYKRNRTDLRVSRLPEAGIRNSYLLGREELGVNDEAGARPRSPRNRAWVANTEFSLGRYEELPTGTETARLGFRADISSPAISIFPRLAVRVGATGFGGRYGTGDSYAILAPDMEISYMLRTDTRLGAGYSYQKGFGQTPFLFDRTDVRQELRLQYSVLGPKWGYDVLVNYDLERKRAYDTMLGLMRRFDCMEVGVAYRTRSQGFNLILNLLPGALSSRHKHASH